MSTIDISRFLHQPRKHYSGGRMQQGRVILDSDFNEEAELDDEEQRHALKDLIGCQGSPDHGFTVGDASEPTDRLRPGDGNDEAPLQTIVFGDGPPTTDVRNYLIRPGTMYVGGMRFTLDDPEFIAFQRDFLQIKGADVPMHSSDGDNVHFLYLHAWEQCVTAVEDREILEKALGGPDTSARVRRMRRVQFLDIDPEDDCGTAFLKLQQTFLNGSFDEDGCELLSHGRMHIEFQPGSGDECAPCDPALGGRYLGAENQAFRIMLTARDKYVWANDNAAPIYRVVVSDLSGDTATIKMLTPPRDVEHYPRGNRVVEIVPWSALLDNGEKVAEEVGVFMRVAAGYDPNTQELTVTDGAAQIADLISRWPSTGVVHPDHEVLNAERAAQGDNPVFYMRVWHVAEDTDHIEIVTSANEPLGNTGLIPVFDAAGRRADFWVVAARPEAPTEIVPNDLLDPAGVPPHGPRHFYAPLGIIRWEDEEGEDEVAAVHDCRRRIHKVVDDCCVVSVGDGIKSLGDVRSIAEAVDLLPPEGGKICILEGVHLVHDEIELGELGNVHIEGCGPNSIIRKVIPDEAEPDDREPIFEIEETGGVLIERLTFECFGPAFAIEESGRVVIRDCRIIGDAGPVLPTSDSSGRALIEIQSDDEAPVNVLLEGLDIEAFGQFGVFVEPGSIDDRIECRHCNFAARSHPSAEAKSAFYVFAPGISSVDEDLEAGFLEIRDCNFDISSESVASVYPAVFLNGLFVTFDSNRVSSAASVYGGVQVQIAIECYIRDNEILGGFGHGVTLGGILWFENGEPITNSSDPIATSGVGSQQTDCPPGGSPGNTGITGNPGTITIGERTAVPTIFSLIELVEIRGNNIFGCGTNGISAISTLPPSAAVDAELPGFQGLLLLVNIIDNYIVNVVAGPLADVEFVEDALPLFEPSVLEPSPFLSDVPSFGISRLPYAAIMLPQLAISNIAGNRILAVGATFNTEPINGIYILFADAVSIEGNSIQSIGESAPSSSTPVGAASPAALKPGTRAGIAIGFAGGSGAFATSNPVAAQAEEILALVTETGETPGLFAIRVIDNAVFQNEGRALEIRGTGAIQVRGNSLASAGNHGAQRASDWFMVGDIVFIQDFGRPWEACQQLALGSPSPVAPDPNFNRTTTFIESYLEAANTAESDPESAELQFVGTGGHVSFTNNEVQYLWELQQVSENPVPLSFSNVFIHSLDHVTCTDNQVASRITDSQGLIEQHDRWLTAQLGIPGSPRFGVLYSSVQVSGFTVNLSHNRIAHCVGDAIFSGNTVGFAENITGFNQTTTCVPAFVFDPDNQDGALFAYSQPLFNFLFPPGDLSPISNQFLCDLIDTSLGTSSGITPRIGVAVAILFSLNFMSSTGWQLPPALSPPPE
jgi:hypothetical protein